MSKAHKGHSRYNDEWKKSISDSLKGRTISWITNTKKSVIQYDKNGNFIKEWGCGFDAAKFLGKQNSAISECCYGKRKTAYGYVWKFKE
jgi:hypothetical protein